MNRTIRSGSSHRVKQATSNSYGNALSVLGLSASSAIENIASPFHLVPLETIIGTIVKALSRLVVVASFAVLLVACVQPEPTSLIAPTPKPTPTVTPTTLVQVSPTSGLMPTLIPSFTPTPASAPTAPVIPTPTTSPIRIPTPTPKPTQTRTMPPTSTSEPLSCGDSGLPTEIVPGPDGPDGPGGHDNDSVFRAVEVHPTDPDTLFLGTERNGFVKSVDGGRTWVRLRQGLKTNGTGYAEVWDIAISRSDPQTMVAATLGSPGPITGPHADSGIYWSPVGRPQLRCLWSCRSPLASGSVRRMCWSALWTWTGAA